MDTSPNKRRVLASVDVNSRTPGAVSKISDLSKSHVTPIALDRSDFGTTKRPLNQEPIHQPQQYQLDQPAKRRRVSVDQGDDDARPDAANEDRGDGENSDCDNGTNDSDSNADAQQLDSDTPDEDSSMFDNSAIDTSQDTMITEPDAEVLAPVPPILSPPRRQPSMTREEARRKAEKLRLRLGLASYKVRTGQTDVPLERLQVKPLPGSRSRSSSHNLGQPELPPLPRPEPASEDFEVEKTPENEDEDQRRKRLAVVARKALPSAPPLRRGSSFSASPPAGRKLLPGLPNGSKRAQ